MAITYPLFAFEKDDQSMRRIEDSSRILYWHEAIDIENGEYVFWDANGNGVTITVAVKTFASKVSGITSSVADFPLREALALYAKSLGISDPLTEGMPIDIWRQIQALSAARGKR
jgi:hypothetical protein